MELNPDNIHKHDTIFHSLLCDVVKTNFLLFYMLVSSKKHINV